jgi:hypothetical protein
MMKAIVSPASLGAAILLGVVALAHAEAPMKEVGSIAGTTLKVIEAATPKLAEQNLRVEDYAVTVFEKDSSFLVLFTDPKQPPGQRGSTTTTIGFEVEISKTGLQVVRANFMR